MNKKLILEKYVKVAVKKALKEQEEQQRKAEKAMYLVHRFPGLKKVIEELMSPAFGRYVNNIEIIAPKPTTFKVDLINGQDFNIKYLGNKKWDVKIAGKKYNMMNIGHQESASQAIADLLELNYAPSEGKEQAPATPAAPGAPAPEAPGTSAAELGPELAAAGPETTAPPAGAAPAPTPAPEEETPTPEEETT
jgi:hypothetical protein